MGRLITFGTSAVVGALAAKALVVAPTVGAAAAAEGTFQDDPIAFFDFVNLRGVSTQLLDAGKNFMAENDRVGHLQLAVKIFHVGAADAAHFDSQKPAVRRNLGNRIFADLELVRPKQRRSS